MKLITTHICMAKDLGVHGNLFGGIMMAWIDEAASSKAVSLCHTPNMVTIKVDELVFKKKVKEGYLIRIYGEVSHMGNTSVTFKIEARKVSVYTHEEDVVVTTNITFVRIDEEGRPTPIPSTVRERFKHLQD
ncbi:MAG: acyl-CoA thioesterase [Bacteroidia bacterium]|nr:acyl-CoA thioesterase [Bacteroidia bacterium]